jgi:hypothetical protein
VHSTTSSGPSTGHAQAIVTNLDTFGGALAAVAAR